MSYFQVRTMPGRIVLIHGMEDRAVVSEMDIDQASVLLEELQGAVLETLAGLHLRADAGLEGAFH